MMCCCLNVHLQGQRVNLSVTSYFSDVDLSDNNKDTLPPNTTVAFRATCLLRSHCSGQATSWFVSQQKTTQVDSEAHLSHIQWVSRAVSWKAAGMWCRPPRSITEFKNECRPTSALPACIHGLDGGEFYCFAAGLCPSSVLTLILLVLKLPQVWTGWGYLTDRTQ